MKSLADQMSFYAAYHRNPVNKAIHFVGIPVIVWSVMLALETLRIQQDWPLSLTVGNVEITLAMVIAAALLIYYLALDYGLGVASVLLFTGLLVSAMRVAELPWAWTAFGIAFVGGWVVQFIGHGVWEKRRPALMSNLFQALIAPIFLVAEVAFALGMKKQLADEVEAKMVAHLPK